MTFWYRFWGCQPGNCVYGPIANLIDPPGSVISVTGTLPIVFEPGYHEFTLGVRWWGRFVWAVHTQGVYRSVLFYPWSTIPGCSTPMLTPTNTPTNTPTATSTNTPTLTPTATASTPSPTPTTPTVIPTWGITITTLHYGGNWINWWWNWYGIDLTNTGTVAAQNIVVTCTIPSQLFNVSPTLGGVWDQVTRLVTWNIPSLGPGWNVHLEVGAQVWPVLVETPITSTITARSPGFPTISAVNKSKIRLKP